MATRSGDQVGILRPTVCREAGRWYVVVFRSRSKETSASNSCQPVAGVDVGLKTAAVVSDGRRLENQKPLALHLKKLSKLQRKLSKKQKTKVSRNEQNHFQSELSEATSEGSTQASTNCGSQTPDVQHKFTTELAQTAGTIGIEDLNLLGMMANRKLAPVPLPTQPWGNSCSS